VGTSAGTSYQDSGPSPSTTYSYTVAAFDTAGNVSAQSAVISVTTLSQQGAPILSQQGAPAVEIPSDAGVWNMKSLGAKGDGVSDDTAAIIAAIQQAPQNTILYFPNGTYLISAPLLWKHSTGSWRAYLAFQGESQSGTILKLKDNLGGAWAAPGNCANSYWLNGQHPDCVANSMIYTGSEGVTYSDGNGNEGYNNYIFDMTIDVGSGNPGAEGIHWLGHNSSAIRNVTVKSEDGKGFMGLDMRTQYFGPALAKNVTVSGFQYGMGIDQGFSSVTMEHITLQNQTTAGFQLMQNIVSVRDLTSVNSVPVIAMSGPAALVLIGGNFSGGSPSNAAITAQSPGQFYLRNVNSSGYNAIAVKDGSAVAGGISVAEYSSSGPVSAFPTPSQALMLPIQETPDYSDNNFANWANVKSYGAVGDGNHDDAAAIQAAIDSGRSTVYMPFGTYRISTEIIVRGNVCMFRGFGSSLIGSGAGYHAIKVQNTTCPSVTVAVLGNSGGFQTPEIEGASTGTVVLKDLFSFGYTTTSGLGGGGNVFLEDVSFGPYYFANQSVWARQLNPENRVEHMINDGGKLWILGLKTENPGSNGVNPSTIVESRNGAKTEVLGGYHSGQSLNGNAINGSMPCNQDGSNPCPMYLTTNSSATVFTVADWVFWNPSMYVVRNGGTGLITTNNLLNGRPGPFYWFMNDYVNGAQGN
jgi:hypothetical protein